MNAETNRNIRIDALRGLAAILVVIGHAIQINVSDFDHNILFILIYSFFMPLFMFVSGFVSYKVDENLGINVIKKRAITLLPPFFSYTLLNYFIVGKKEYDLIEWFVVCLKKPDMSLWFLWVLFLNNIFLVIAYQLSKKLGDITYIVIILCCVLMYVKGIYIEYGFSFCIWYLPFFFAGFLISKYGMKLKSCKKYILLISLFLFIPCAWRWRRTEIFVTYIGSMIKNYSVLIIYDRLYNYFIAFIGIASCIALVYWILSEKAISMLAFVGRYSLGIYFFNVWMISSIKTSDVFINIYIGIIIGVIGSVFLSKILEKNKILGMLILGKGIKIEKYGNEDKFKKNSRR